MNNFRLPKQPWNRNVIHPKYKVLAVSQLSSADKAKISAEAALIVSGPEAMARRGTDNWGYVVTDRVGNAGVLTYKGVEVRFFYKRQVAEIQPLPMDPVPEGIITDPLDVWCSLDLLGASAKQVCERLRKKHVVAGDEISLLQSENINLTALVDSLEKTNIRLEQERDSLASQAGKGHRTAGQNRQVGHKDALLELLPVAEALTKAKDDPNVQEKKLFGILHAMLSKVYAEFKAQFISPRPGDAFDPSLHEAVAVSDKADPDMIGSVSSQGLLVDGQVARAAKVSVGGKK